MLRKKPTSLSPNAEAVARVFFLLLGLPFLLMLIFLLVLGVKLKFFGVNTALLYFAAGLAIFVAIWLLARKKFASAFSGKPKPRKNR